MIWAQFDQLEAFRMLTPKWAIAPKSGEGAAENGGRVNRCGVAALYLSLDPGTAIREYQQDDPLVPPGTLVSYRITVDRLLDFRGGFQSDQWPMVWEDFFRDWRSILLDQGVEPPSWAIGDDALKAQAQGIVFASQAAPGGVNLVLYAEALTAADVVQVFDPQGALPKNQKSWE